MRMLNYDFFRNLVLERELNDPVYDFRLRCSGRTLDMENDQTLESYGVNAAHDLHLVFRLLGGAKKGVKKVTKQEKLHITRAASMYQASLVDPAQVGPLLDNIRTNDQYITTTIQSMTVPQLQQLKQAFDDLAYVREQSVVGAMLPYIAPAAANIANHITHLENQMAQLKIQEDALKACITTALATEFYVEQQYDFSSLFEMIPNTIEEIRERERQAQLQQLQQQQAAMAAEAARVAEAARSDMET